jgi:glycosyltransferase involved in cell wall biosynthesis
MTSADLPQLSIIIVVLNGAKTLRRAIESVLRQSYAHADLMIIDGGSTDGTLEIIETYSDQLSYFVSQKDEGIYDAMNHALENCRGDWCLFLGCDDVLLDCLHLVAPRLRHECAVYYGNVIWRSNGRIYDGQFSRFKLVYRNICHQSIFYPKSVFHKKYDKRYPLLADYKHNIELWGSGVDFRHVGYVVADYNDCGSASAGDDLFLADKGQILRSNLGLWAAVLWEMVKLVTPLYQKLVRIHR